MTFLLLNIMSTELSLGTSKRDTQEKFEKGLYYKAKDQSTKHHFRKLGYQLIPK